jgi:hypothetical protein
LRPADNSKNLRVFALTAVTLVLLAANVFVFQACSWADGRMHFTGSTAVQASGGDGRPIESKPDAGTYYHFAAGVKCTDVFAFAEAVEVGENYLRHLTINKVDCSIVATDIAVDKVQWAKFNDGFLGLGPGIFQKLQNPPNTDPLRLLNQRPIAEAWCRLRNPQISADIVIMTNPQSGERLATAFTLNGNKPEISGPLSVTRSTLNKVVSYAIDGISMQVDIKPTTAEWSFCSVENAVCAFSGTSVVRYGANGSYVTAVSTNGIGCSNMIFPDPAVGFQKTCETSSGQGTSVGHITATLAGVAVSDVIDCRMGADHDSMQPTGP